MGFNDVNEAIRTGGGGYTKLNTKGQVLEGILLDVSVRDKVYKGKVVPSNSTGLPRKEWLFVLETKDGVTKFAAVESAQIAVKNALKEGQKLEKGGKIRFEVTESSVQGEKSPEFVVEYIEPKFTTVTDDEDVPF